MRERERERGGVNSICQSARKRLTRDWKMRTLESGRFDYQKISSRIDLFFSGRLLFTLRTVFGPTEREQTQPPPRLRKCYRSREQRESVAKFMARNCARSVPYNPVINHLPTMILFAASGPSVTYRDAPRTAGTIHHRDA